MVGLQVVRNGQQLEASENRVAACKRPGGNCQK
jgi:hypothetical protein